MDDKKFFVGVKALIANAEGEILVLRKVPRRASDRWKPFWDIPGGKIQDGGIKETLIREVEEELGINYLKVLGLFDVAIANFDVHEGDSALGGLFFVIYNCKIPAGSKIMLSAEHSEYKWASLREAKELLAFMLPKEILNKLSDKS